MQPYSELFKAGELVFAEGDAPTCAYLIEAGRIEISTTQLGEPRLLAELGPGMLLGEMAVLDDSTRTASARALTDCRLIPIDKAQFAERLAHADPVVRALLMSQLTRYRSALARLTGEADGFDAAPTMQPDDAYALDKIRLESDLRAALDRKELEVRLQPIEEIVSGRIAGYEALVRWQHPERGAVSPAEFIRLAEETSLIVPIGDYVLARVCDMLVELRERGRKPLPFIAANLSGRQIDDPGLVQRILDLLHARDLPPDKLKLEVTESLVMDHARIGDLIAHCHSVGMPVALDDFGTGYSNLGPLLTLNFDQIKLDASFIKALDRPRGVAMVGVIVGMARALDCDLVAEGVETREQREILHRLGCRYAQGWLVGKPLSLGDVLEH
ncbi:EAL domain-containing protein [Dokdonella fugitiva]|uniref:EAL domain-containing protein (Putative c-di-GMP-specific phosphodiesterase class I) n=1 Tax=Dokdonella fugitiva TaxID=328517 RepID=A0A4R2I240_9GAMM|nr:EAL domain-containing protein [Dokdonella fugitiva]MBA8884711.1 EAL domain-containing protein (putative c-di-GMP-specific phosphodiesterase class I) [Dokdonella fugitiva]TCO37706.1 EAL domain-containing protein (putative c-di-GMP-specific phosphodiesterase class I) [Dokdonella fugitiva]